MSHQNASQFDAWLDRFFDHYYRRRPVNATFIGVHEHDHALPDCSESGLRQSAGEMRTLLTDLAGIPGDGLSESQRHDRQIAEGFLEIQLWEDAAPHFHRGNPAYYTGEGVFSVIGLFQRDSEPLSERVAAAISRMELLPEFLGQGRANVGSSPAAWTESAIKEAKSTIVYFDRGTRILAQDRGITDRRFLEASQNAKRAFEEHLQWLEGTLAKSTTDSVAASREAFDLYLAKGHCLSPTQNTAWVKSWARQQIDEAKIALEEDAARLDPSTPWRAQLAKLQDLHPTFDEYYGSFGKTFEAAKQSAIEHDLVTWPDYPLDFVPVPRSDREARGGLYYLWYRCPPPFGRKETHRYLVTPIEPDMPADERERLLRANNDSQIKLNHVVHHGGLGHHVQNYNAFRAESRFGKMAGVDCSCRIAVFAAGTLVEGWACYATDLMNEVGFLTPLESLAERHQRVRMAARAFVDASLHDGDFTLDQAAAFYESETAMPAAAARGEAIKNSMFPGAAAMYLIGIDAIRDLRREVARREGSAFSLRRFHDRFLSYGAIPVSLIAKSMLGSTAS